MIEGFRNFFNSEEYMPHGHCFLWEPHILWLHVISDAGIVAAYFSIPFALVYLVWKRKDMPFDTVFFLFGAFILLCGTTHLIGIWTIWYPDFAIEGVVKAMTAIVSVATFFVTVKLIPKALALPSPSQLAKVNDDLEKSILKREAAQKELRDAYSQMERKVEDRNQELNKAVKDLASSNAELDQFAYIVSHDLKEPLRGLMNQATFLQEDYQDKLGEDGFSRLSRLIYLSKRMEKLIDDLLYFSRLGHVELAVQETDINMVIAEITQMLESFLAERKAEIIIPKRLPPIVCDKPRVTELFRNLITNAVKYNDKEKKIVEIGFLEAATGPNGAERNVYYVKDNGKGIAKQFYEEIFRIFKRLEHDSKDEKESGTGVGLTFVKKIVERHNGEIWLDSEPGKGTSFFFTLNTRS